MLDSYGFKIVRRGIFLNHTKKGWAVDEETESDHGTFDGRRLAGPFKRKQEAIDVKNEIVQAARSRSNPIDSEDYLRIAVGIGLVVGLGVMLWNKAQDDAIAAAGTPTPPQQAPGS